jgi:ABC-type cobalamin/Fe3+-siderophores transport system ATPase subunit
MFPTMSVQEHSISIQLHFWCFSPIAQVSCILLLVLVTGHLAMRYIDQISGGELQKVSLARAFVQEPKLLLFDEPTSNLDLKNQIEILKITRRIVKEHEVSAVMTMHDLNKALRYADKCLFLKEEVGGYF